MSSRLDPAFFGRLIREILPDPFQTPVEWSSKNIIFNSPGDPIQGNIDFEFSPFLRDPLNAWDLQPGDGPREITVCAVEQTGKTLLWMMGLLYSMTVQPGLSMIFYTSEDKAKKVNAHKLDPLISNIPQFAELLADPFSHTKESYQLGPNTVYFGGVGSRVSSFTTPRVIMDEIDDWPVRTSIDEVEDIRKRLRSFKQSVLCKVCTVKGSETQSRIWREFLQSSQGFYTLRCLQCGGLTMRSCDVRNLSFARTENGEIIPESLRLICPNCGRKHTEDEKASMITGGAYVHGRPERLKSHPGFQWGALASQMPFAAWLNIARMQAKAGASGYIRDQIIFDNSFRGLPFKVRKFEGDAARIVKKHCAPAPEELLYRLFAVDTQEDSFYWTVRGFDRNKNSFLLSCGHARNFTELAAAWEAKYHGKRCMYGIIDEGGHREADVRAFAFRAKAICTYKGNNAISSRWKKSKEINNLLIVKESVFRLELLQAIYEKQEASGSYDWHLPESVPTEYMDQILDYHADERKTDGKQLENFVSSGQDHYFDCEKMTLALNEYFCSDIFPRLCSIAKQTGKLQNLLG